MNYDRIYHIASHHVVYVEYKNTTHLKITGNVFRNNSGYGAIKIDAASQSICRRCSIEDNVFINNTNLQVKREHGYKDWGIKETIRMSGKFHLSLKNNYFDNPDAQFEVTMPSYDGEVTDASGCYWGETSYRNITNRLKCFYNDMSLGLMKFWPYRTSPNNKKLVQRSAEYSFFSEEIGGFVTTNITIRIRQTPYVVGRSMYITENASLTIEAGVTLLFKRDRGVTVKGMIHLQGTADRPIYLNRSSLRPTDWNYHTFPIPWTWAGIVIETNRMDALSISNVAIGGSDSGLRMQKDGVVTIRNCRFYENNKGLQLLSERADVTVTNSEFHHNGFGIVLVDSRTLAIHGCRFTKQIKSGIKGSPGISRQRPETVTIADNTFASNNGAIDLRTSKSTNLRLVRNAIHYSVVKLIVSQCELTFQENNLSTQLDITARNSTIVVRNNTWKRCGRAIWLHYTDDSQTTIENNVFHATTSTYGLIYFYYGGNATLRIRSNEFTENDGMSVIEMDTWTENAKPLEIYWNIFFMNKMNLGIIHVIETSEIHYNSFNNPNTSHDCVVGDVSIDGVTDSSLGRRGVTNATYNWWGVSTESGVSKRIRIGDYNRCSELDKHTVKWQPFLTHAPHKSCSKVNNCSGHGDCVLQDTCECHTGWTGGLCDRCSDNYYGPRCLPSVETTTPRTSTTTERYTPTKTITTSMPLKTTTTPEIKHTTAGRTCTTACYVLDVVFALDAAGSILRENWSRMTDFFDHFLARMDVNDNCARVSVVTFGSAATLQFGLRAHDNAGSVRRAIEKVGMASPARNFADGIRKVRTAVFNNRDGDRRDAQNVCVFITDGTSGMKQQDALTEASLAKADGINLQVIGIGGNVHLSELSSIASANAIHLNNFGDLNVDGALQMLYSYMDDLKQTLASTTMTTTTRTTATTTTTTEPTTTNAVTVFSWQCSFEGSTGKGSICNMIQFSSDDFDWSLRSGRTPSSETGPNSGYGGSGHYIYIEASQPRRKNDKAMIMLPSFNQDAEYCLSFYYNMNGFHINTLQVAKRTTSGQLVQLWTKNGNQGPHWHSAQVSAELNNSDQLAFIGIRGDAYSGDIAIDNVSVRSGRCLG